MKPLPALALSTILAGSPGGLQTSLPFMGKGGGGIVHIPDIEGSELISHISDKVKRQAAILLKKYPSTTGTSTCTIFGTGVFKIDRDAHIILHCSNKDEEWIFTRIIEKIRTVTDGIVIRGVIIQDGEIVPYTGCTRLFTFLEEIKVEQDCTEI